MLQKCVDIKIKDNRIIDYDISYKNNKKWKKTQWQLSNENTK